MPLVRRSSTVALGAALLAAGLAGCTGTGSQQAREENQKMDCMTRCGKELERETGRPILLARSQGPDVQELPPVRLGVPTAPPSTPAVPMLSPIGGDPGVPAEGIRSPDVLAPTLTPPT